MQANYKTIPVETNAELAEFLKSHIYNIERSKEKAKSNPDTKIVSVTLTADVFLKMAYLFVGIHGK